MGKKALPIATLDIETDPFRFGCTPMPFAIGFYDADVYMQFWGDDCVQKMIEWLDDYPPRRIYVHNGGGFDFWYLQEWITAPVFFIRSRIAKCGLLGKHEMRDSYRMIPVPLKDYMKEEISYDWFWPKERERHRKEISYYLQKDCEYLYSLVTDFISRFGLHLTIGGAAIKLLRNYHPNRHESELFDEQFRPYYFGGRNQVFEKGELHGAFKVYDVNSMYPDVMRNCQHPFGGSFAKSKHIPDAKFSFARITAESHGALPIANKGLLFPHGVNEFWACSHEIHTGEELGLLKVLKVHECITWKATQNFKAFIDMCVSKKIEADEKGDQGGRTFYKLFMNTPYGKFGQNPRNYEDCDLFDDYQEAVEHGYEPKAHLGERIIGFKPADIADWSFNNVAIAASITSASRAKLMVGISRSVRPVYCDTDSIICEQLDMELHDNALGAWKNETPGGFDTIYIAAKKLYACYDKGEPLLIGKPGKQKEKKACKGANLSAHVIKDVALGTDFVCNLDAPLLKMGQPAKFISRVIRQSA